MSAISDIATARVELDLAEAKLLVLQVELEAARRKARTVEARERRNRPRWYEENWRQVWSDATWLGIEVMYATEDRDRKRAACESMAPALDREVLP